MSHIASALDKFQGENSKSQTVIIAAVTHPFIKLRWLSNPEMKKVAEGLFLHKLHKIEPMTDFSGFASVQSEDVNPSQSDARIQGLQFLQNPSHNTQQLHRYAAVAKLLIKCNTTLLSSATVERLLSAAGQLLLPRRNRLQDNMFEILLFLNKNAHFVA